MTGFYRKRMGLMLACAALLQAGAQAEKVSASADIVFKGSSTLHDFEGTVAANPFIAVIEKDPETGKARIAGSTSITVQNMTTSNKKRDKNMLKMFDAAHFKLIEGTLAQTLLAEGETVTAPLHLKICNAENNVAATLSNFHREGNQISCSVTFPVSLKAFGLKPPSVVGLIRVDDTVIVECTVKGTIGAATPQEG